MEAHSIDISVVSTLFGLTLYFIPLCPWYLSTYKQHLHLKLFKTFLIFWIVTRIWKSCTFVNLFPACFNWNNIDVSQKSKLNITTFHKLLGHFRQAQCKLRMKCKAQLMSQVPCFHNNEQDLLCEIVVFTKPMFYSSS